MQLPDAWIVSGAVIQPYLNQRYGYPPEHGIKDIDIFYYDGADLSEESEAKTAARVRDLLLDVDLPMDIKNQARVHLWYEQKFGRPITQFENSAAAITCFQTVIGAVGMRKTGDLIEIVADSGFADLEAGIVRPLNRKSDSVENYTAKAKTWQDRWPELKIIPRSDG